MILYQQVTAVLTITNLKKNIYKKGEEKSSELGHKSESEVGLPWGMFFLSDVICTMDFHPVCLCFSPRYCMDDMLWMFI